MNSVKEQSSLGKRDAERICLNWWTYKPGAGMTVISNINMCDSKYHSQKHRYDCLWYIWVVYRCGIPVWYIYLVWAVLVYHTHGLTVNLTRYGLISVEFYNISISSDVQILDLSHNSISQISWFPPYPSLRKYPSEQ